MKFCVNCNKELIRREKEKASDYKVRKFCNQSCSATFNNKNYPRKKKEKEYKPNVVRKEFRITNCQKCNIEIKLELLSDKRHYSSSKYCLECRKTHSKNIVSSSTKAELFDRSKNWQSARSAIRKHAERIMKASDLIPECKVCKYSTHVEICHIKPVSDFKDEALIKEINDINNLVYLCPNRLLYFE